MPAPRARRSTASIRRCATPRPTPPSASSASWRRPFPNNAGTLDSILVTAPDNTIVNALYPGGGQRAQHHRPHAARRLLRRPAPGDPGPGAGRGHVSNLWNLKLGAGHGMTGTIGNSRPFMVTTFHSGGAGARPTLDGLSATPFPSGVRNVPVEITETIAPVVMWKKEYRPDSGGAGEHRGGLGQVMEVEHREGAPFGIFATFERVKHPARGRDGGKAGGNGRLSLASGTGAEGQGLPDHPGRRAPGGRDAGRRRLRRSDEARSGSRQTRHQARPGQQGSRRRRPTASRATIRRPASKRWTMRRPVGRTGRRWECRPIAPMIMLFR